MLKYYNSLITADPGEHIFKTALTDAPICNVKPLFVPFHLDEESFGVEPSSRHLEAIRIEELPDKRRYR